MRHGLDCAPASGSSTLVRKSRIWPLGRPLVKGWMEWRLFRKITAYPAWPPEGHQLCRLQPGLDACATASAHHLEEPLSRQCSPGAAREIVNEAHAMPLQGHCGAAGSDAHDGADLPAWCHIKGEVRHLQYSSCARVSCRGVERLPSASCCCSMNVCTALSTPPLLGGQDAKKSSTLSVMG